MWSAARRDGRAGEAESGARREAETAFRIGPACREHPCQRDHGDTEEQEQPADPREMRRLLAVRGRAEQPEAADEHDDRGDVGRAETEIEDDDRGQRGDADAAGDRGLDDEQRQRAQCEDRRDEADEVERETGDVGKLASQASEQHHVEVFGRGRAPCAGRL